MFELKCASFYLAIVLSSVGLLLVPVFGSGNIYVLVPLAALVSLFVLAVSKKSLRIAETFPEVVRLPVLREIFT